MIRNDLTAPGTGADNVLIPVTTPTTGRRHYIGRHRAGKHRDRRTIDQAVGDDYTPLSGATRTSLAPHHYQRPDIYVPATTDELTGRLDAAAVTADQPAPVAPAGTRADVLAEMRAAAGRAATTARHNHDQARGAVTTARLADLQARRDHTEQQYQQALAACEALRVTTGDQP